MSASFDRPTAAPGTLERLAYRAGRVLGRIQALPAPPPWIVLGALVVASWGIAAEAGRVARHNGWLYYHGGTGTWYYTSAWALGNGHLPRASLGYGYPLLIAPFARIAGASMLDGLPWIIAFNQLVLAPIALLSLYGIVRMFASRWYAYLATLLWVVFPVLVIHYFLADYHTRYVDITLPAEVGLTPLGDFPSMVVLLVAAYFALRHVQTRAGVDAVAAGLAAGLAIAIKPANLLFLPAAAGALLVGRRLRGLGLFALALVPALVSLAIWKHRGLGYVPAFADAAPLAVVLPLGFGLDLSRYVSFNWWHLHHNFDGLREYTWSQRLIYFVAGGGLIGLLRRWLPAATLAGLWLAAYVIVKGTATNTEIVTGTFFAPLIAAFPAFFLLVVSVPFLIPVYGGRRPAAALQPASREGLPKVACGVLGAILVIGLLAVSVLPKLPSASAAVTPGNLYVPLNGFTLAARTNSHGVTLSWSKRAPSGTRATYAIFRSPSGSPVCSPAGWSACTFDSVRIGSVDTKLDEPYVTSFTDRPPAGGWTYRVALSATPLGAPIASDFVLFSRPVSVTVRAAPAGK